MFRGIQTQQTTQTRSWDFCVSQQSEDTTSNVQMCGVLCNDVADCCGTVVVYVFRFVLVLLMTDAGHHVNPSTFTVRKL